MNTLNTIEQLARLASEGQLVYDVDWNSIGYNREEIFYQMASSVVQQLESVPDEQRAVVAMATMTKLLVENFVLSAKLQGKA